MTTILQQNKTKLFLDLFEISSNLGWEHDFFSPFMAHDFESAPTPAQQRRSTVSAVSSQVFDSRRSDITLVNHEDGGLITYGSDSTLNSEELSRWFESDEYSTDESGEYSTDDSHTLFVGRSPETALAQWSMTGANLTVAEVGLDVHPHDSSLLEPSVLDTAVIRPIEVAMSTSIALQVPPPHDCVNEAPRVIQRTSLVALLSGLYSQSSLEEPVSVEAYQENITGSAFYAICSVPTQRIREGIILLCQGKLTGRCSTVGWASALCRNEDTHRLAIIRVIARHAIGKKKTLLVQVTVQRIVESVVMSGWYTGFYWTKVTDGHECGMTLPVPFVVTHDHPKYPGSIEFNPKCTANIYTSAGKTSQPPDCDLFKSEIHPGEYLIRNYELGCCLIIQPNFRIRIDIRKDQTQTGWGRVAMDATGVSGYLPSLGTISSTCMKHTSVSMQHP
ncbi:hypothetical protein C8R46DRAFT_1044527 [Mycena filopes]|nr:hypothetical protein C8R46DRAFT_1044527 [Mycena filopes]